MFSFVLFLGINMKKLCLYAVIIFGFLMVTFMPMMALAQDVKTFIPPNALKYTPMYKDEVYRLIPTITNPEYFAALTEHESCVSLKSKRCFDPTAELLTAREQGVGLGQITRTKNADGTIRFDSLTDLRSRHMAELQELSWSNVKERPDLQMRQVIVMTKDNLKQLFQVTDETQRFKMADAAYNGGIGHTKKERLQCGLTKGCDPQYWDNHVEMIKSIKSQKPIYGNRSAWDINRHHVKDVWVRMPKYVPLMRKQCD